MHLFKKQNLEDIGREERVRKKGRNKREIFLVNNIFIISSITF
jgi:hypothetical protein